MAVNWVHSLKVPSDKVADVVALLREETFVIKLRYDAVVRTYNPSVQPLLLVVVAIEGRPRSVSVEVESDDISVNALSEAIESVIPESLGVRVPYWS